MGSLNLPVNVDSQYADSPTDPSVKAHQQIHDKIHGFVNLFDVDAARSDGDLLAWDDALQLWVPIDPSLVEGLTPVATTYATAAPGTVFRIRWTGTAWPASRPSNRADIYFDLAGAPTGTAAPTWLLPGDNAVPAASSSGGSGGGSGTTVTGLVVFQNASDADRRVVPAGGLLLIVDNQNTGIPPQWMQAGDIHLATA